MDGRRSVLIGSESDSSAYIGIFPPMSNRSWMSDCRTFLISKWKNLALLTSCSRMSSLAYRIIDATNWKGRWFCPTPHWKAPSACMSRWSAWCVGHCGIAWSGRVARPQSRRCPIRTKSNQDEADTHLTRSRWNVAASPWRVHAAQ